MANKQRLVVFKVGTEEFAADILLIKRVEVMRDITPVPETRSYVEGIMNLRGNLVPIIDLRKRLLANNSAGKVDNRIIIANLEGKVCGLIVDDASEVIRVDSDEVEVPPDVIAEMGVDYVSGVINLGDRFITLIDLRKALAGEITCELEEVMKVLSPSSVLRDRDIDGDDEAADLRAMV